MSSVSLQWPEGGVTRAPYRAMSDPDLYRMEQERIFRGLTWNYLCLEAELPEHGSYVATHIGDTPVIATRDRAGEIHAMVNRCSHKGSILCVEPRGNKKALTCLYHAWSFDLSGNLVNVAFEKGVNGKGGMPESFQMCDHNLEKLGVAVFHGIVFATFSDKTEPIDQYLGPGMVAHLSRVFAKPVEVLGYYHHTMQNNWKLYMENSRDPYHATILHAFYATFKLNRLTMDGGLTVEHRGWHTINFSKGATMKEGEYEGSGMRGVMDDVTLADRGVIASRQEFPDGITVAIQSMFPSCVNQQIYNTLAIRHLVPQGPDKCELHWTVFGYEDDDEELREMRLKQANLIGPAGYVSVDDGAIVEYVQRGIAGSGYDKASVMEMGGSEVASVSGSRATETTLRGFWVGYRDLMGF